MSTATAAGQIYRGRQKFLFRKGSPPQGLLSLGTVIISAVSKPATYLAKIRVLKRLYERGASMSKKDRDIEKTYSKSEFVSKLRRLADSIENEEKFEIQIAGERIYVPANSAFNIEHEREDGQEEVEFQIKWKND